MTPLEHLLFAWDAVHGTVSALQVSGRHVEYDHYRGLDRAGFHGWSALLGPHLADRQSGLYVWEGAPVFVEEGEAAPFTEDFWVVVRVEGTAVHYPRGTIRRMRLDEWAKFGAGRDLWPRMTGMPMRRIMGGKR